MTRLGVAPSAGTVAMAIVALAVAAAVGGGALGARVAAEAEPPADLASAPAAEDQPLPLLRSVTGRLAGVRGDLIGVRPAGGPPVPVDRKSVV